MKGDNSWINNFSGTSDAGTKVVDISVFPNNTNSERQVTIVVKTKPGQAHIIERRITVTQLRSESNFVRPRTSFQIRPNPAKERVYIDLPGQDINEVFDLMFWDIRGIVVLKKRGINLLEGQNVLSVDTGNIPSGVYTVKLIGKEMSFQQKLIIAY